MSNIVTGEKIQQLCDIYLGIQSDFHYNPIIGRQTEKHCHLNNITGLFNNPHRVFCYGDKIHLLSQKIHLFQNDFILVTHNSDGEIRETSEVHTILNCEKVLKWFGQNICVDHPKLHFLPIGIANSQWAHGNLSLFYDTNFMQNVSSHKSNKIYFNFRLHTSPEKRQVCYDNLKNKLQWLNNISPLENLKRLSSYEFCICPEGNGSDTHRLWECLYLKVVPIVLKNEFTKILLKNGVPLVILDKWDNIDINSLNYQDFNFDNEQLNNCLNFAYFQRVIANK